MNHKATSTGHAQTCNNGVIACTWITKQLLQDMHRHVTMVLLHVHESQATSTGHALTCHYMYTNCKAISTGHALACDTTPRHVILMLLKVHESRSNFHRHDRFHCKTLMLLHVHQSQTTSHTTHRHNMNVSFSWIAKQHPQNTGKHVTWSHDMYMKCEYYMNVTTCTWIANVWHECHYMYMNCKHGTWMSLHVHELQSNVHGTHADLWY